MSRIFFTFLLFLSSAPLYVLSAELGPPQVCRCYPVGTDGACTSGGNIQSQPISTGQKCTKHVSVNITFVGDDGVKLWICGRMVYQSSHFDERQSFIYSGYCDDFMLEVTNEAWSSGVAVLATMNGHKYGTTDRSGEFGVPGTYPLYGIAKYQPAGNWVQNPPGYDFSSWTPAVVVKSILGHGENFKRMESEGAYPINVASGDVDSGTYGVKVPLPRC